jgi:hypothetical protein
MRTSMQLTILWIFETSLLSAHNTTFVLSS